MPYKKQKQRQANGFTIIELLVVVSIIVMIIGILVPGIQSFKRSADNLKQKSRFHSMEVGLALYQKDFLEYPESQALPLPSSPVDVGAVTGAHRLAEALLGRDLRGFDPESTWYAPADADTPQIIYANDNNSVDDEDIEASKLRRKGPYMDLKDVGAFNLGAGNDGEWYASGAAVSTRNGETIYGGMDAHPQPVISDIFYKKIIRVTNLETDREVDFRVGTPVLYFKANEAEKKSRGYDEDGDGEITDYRKLIYNYEDNEAMFELGVIDEPSKIHHYSMGYSETIDSVPTAGDGIFYEDITNEKVDQYVRPVNARGFLLISAGRDGIFGTNDDVTNFDK